MSQIDKKSSMIYYSEMHSVIKTLKRNLNLLIVGLVDWFSFRFMGIYRGANVTIHFFNGSNGIPIHVGRVSKTTAVIYEMEDFMECLEDDFWSTYHDVRYKHLSEDDITAFSGLQECNFIDLMKLYRDLLNRKNIPHGFISVVKATIFCYLQVAPKELRDDILAELNEEEFDSLNMQSLYDEYRRSITYISGTQSPGPG